MITPTMLLYAASTIAATATIVILVYDMCRSSKLEFENHRKCAHCGVIFQEGYIDERDNKTYCSEQCARDDMTELEYQRGIRNNQLFWVSFYE